MLTTLCFCGVTIALNSFMVGDNQLVVMNSYIAHIYLNARDNTLVYCRVSEIIAAKL
jgi:hypothetical protein